MYHEDFYGLKSIETWSRLWERIYDVAGKDIASGKDQEIHQSTGQLLELVNFLIERFGRVDVILA